MNSMRWFFVPLLIILFTLPALASDKKPGWVEQRPVNTFFYIGIGSAARDGEVKDYRQAAKDNALQDLASEIQVKISSDMLHTISETSGIVEEDLKSQVRSTTRANLEGFELVDAWEDAETYWVYYRLSKDVYKKLRAERRESARFMAFDLYKKGREQMTGGRVGEALNSFVQGLGALDEFLGEPLSVDYGGQKVLVQNELFASLQGLLNSISLTTQQAQIEATAGKSLAKALEVQAKFVQADGKEQPAAGLQINFQFIRGNGDLLSEAQTDAQGRAFCTVSRISGDKLQIIEARLSLGKAALTSTLLKKLNRPAVRFILKVSGVRVYVQAQEQNLGRPVELLQVEPKLKNGLAEQGFSFTDEMGNADILIELKVSARKGAQVYNLYSAFADMNISVTDLRNGNEVYKQSFPNIKGIQLDFEKAGLTALQNSGKKVEQILPEIIKQLR